MNVIKRWFCHLLLTSAAALVLFTILPVVQTNEWWVRVWDYPRPQLLGLSLVVLALLVWWLPGFKRWSYVITGALVLAAAFQAWRIVAYTPLWPTEMASAETKNGDACVTVMIANVLMDNRQSGRIRDLISSEEPDIVFIVENDSWWSDELQTLSSRYETVIDQPQNNTYGLLFMTNLPADDVQLRFLSEPEIPSIRAAVQLPDGQWFNFYGLHPKPPRLGQDTDVRDHELTVVAKEIRQEKRASIVGGDLNDVAWSHTTRLFKRITQMLDPRKGRGLYASYHAEYPILRWPLDHIFATDIFEISRLELLSYIGSDHFPVLAEFCAREDAANDNSSQDKMQSDDREEMQETLTAD